MARQVKGPANLISDSCDPRPMWILVAFEAISGSSELDKRLAGGFVDQLYAFSGGHFLVCCFPVIHGLHFITLKPLPQMRDESAGGG
jgi:hypothetical protein